MRWIRLPLLLLPIGCATLLGGCRHGSRVEKRVPQSEEPAQAVPTPDTTPVEILRTPAGLTLKLGEAPAVTPTRESPAASTTQTQKSLP
ncbi:MAG: hypothetical protein ACRD1P_11430 [Thermoanaerobaculia bacterium]